MILKVFVLFIIVILLDIYTFSAFKWIPLSRRSLISIYLLLHLPIYVGAWTVFFFRDQLPMPWTYLILSIAFAWYVFKLGIALFLSIEDIVRLIHLALNSRFFSSTTPPEESSHSISRSTFISQAAIITSSIPFGGIWYGMLKGKYQYQINRINVPISGLPQSFHGLTITQISDIHNGSFDNKEAVTRGIELIQSQESDLIFFTGDLINETIGELSPFEDLWRTLHARDGVFSILGNHDFGDYTHWPTKKAKEAHFREVIESHDRMGWRLLRNEHVILNKGKDQMAVIGVDNWSAIERFPRYGDLHKAVQGSEKVPLKLLLSHDPTHWEAQVLQEFPDIGVTFSGHTHGFQMGVEIPGIKWSPAQYLYKQWAGLYEENNQYLYVNRGFGFIGFSGRLGIWPEITVFTLVPANEHLPAV